MGINMGDEEEEAVIDIVDDSEEVNTLVEAEIEAEIADIEAEIIARQVAQEYAVWYERTYTPWHNARMKEVEESQSYMPWFLNLNEVEDDDESEELMSEEHAEALEQMALYNALMEDDGDESQVSEGDDQITGLEGVDQEIIENFNQAMEKLQENYLAMIQTGEDE